MDYIKHLKIVVLGRNYNSILGMVRAVGEAGYKVNVIKIQKKRKLLNRIIHRHSVDAKSKYIDKYIKAVDLDEESTINLILKEFNNSNDKIILIPTDDYVASIIDNYQDRLPSNFLFPNIDYGKGAVIEMMDKDVQKELAIRAGLNVAKGWVIEIKNKNFDIPDDIIYPVFTKPQVSILGDKSFMKRCVNQQELEQTLKELSGISDCPILVEEYIEIEKEYGVLGFCDKDNVLIPILVNKVAVANGNHKGVTLIGEIRPIEDYGQLKVKLSDFLRTFNFLGLVDIDLYESNGKIYFNELNLRLGAFGYAAMIAGINLPKLLIDSLQNINHNKLDFKLEKTITCISDKVNLEDYESGYITWKQYKDNYLKADVRFIQSESDNNPYRLFKRNERIIRIKKMIKGIIN